MSGDFSLQFDTVPLKTKRGENVLVTRSAPETRTAYREPVTMSFVGLITDSTRVRNIPVGGAVLEP
jgi:hypothetical protein